MRAEHVSSAWWRLTQGDLEWTRLMRNGEGVIFDKARSGSVVGVRQLGSIRTGPVMRRGPLFERCSRNPERPHIYREVNVAEH